MAMVWHGKRILGKIERQAPRIVSGVAETITQRARQLVPVRTGKLRDSIKAGPDSVTSDVPYAGSIEFGTARRAAQPFLRPAIEQFNRDDLQRCIRKSN